MERKTRQSQIESVTRYEQRFDKIRILIDPEQKMRWREAARASGLSMTALIKKSVDDYISRHVDDAASS